MAGKKAFRVQTKGALELERKLRKAGVAINMRAWLTDACKLVVAQSKKKHFIRGTKSKRRKQGSAPRRDILTSRTHGRGLQSAITYKVEGHGKKVTGRVGVSRKHPAARYAPVHEGELGDPVIIRAKRKPFLAFRLHTGQFVMVKQVKIRARPYLRPALLEKEKAIRKLYGVRMRRALKRARLI